MKKKTQKIDRYTKTILFCGALMFVAVLVTHAADGEAEFRCRELVKQAKDFKEFYMTDTERAMCASVGITVNEPFQREVEPHAGTTIATPEFGAEQEVPEWYTRQQYVKEKELAYLNLYPKLQRICACESTGDPDGTPRHYENDGVTVLTGRITPEDIGMCQINTYFWEDRAIELGLDITDPHDNVSMANYIYRKYGAQPWYPSKKCHGYD